jgi:cobalt transporter subunit CbtB
MLSGVAVKEITLENSIQITDQTQSLINSNMMAIIFAAFVGLSIVAITGHVQASALHDAAHDMRHATGFPCH